MIVASISASWVRAPVDILIWVRLCRPGHERDLADAATAPWCVEHRLGLEWSTTTGLLFAVSSIAAVPREGSVVLLGFWRRTLPSFGLGMGYLVSSTMQQFVDCDT